MASQKVAPQAEVGIKEFQNICHKSNERAGRVKGWQRAVEMLKKIGQESTCRANSRSWPTGSQIRTAICSEIQNVSPLAETQEVT